LGLRPPEPRSSRRSVPLSGAGTLLSSLSLPGCHPWLDLVPLGRPRRLARTEDRRSAAPCRPFGRAREAAARVPRGATSEAVDLASSSSEEGTARVATCPGERETVARPAPRTTARGPVEGRRAEACRGSPRAAEPEAFRPRDAVRCLSPMLGRARPPLLAKRDRMAPPAPALPPETGASASRSWTKVRAEVRPPPPWLNGP
jgi:hypothetical protein